MHQHIFRKVVVTLAIFFSVGIGPFAYSQTTNIPEALKSGGKEVLIPTTGITRVPDGNDYSNPDSEYSFKHCKATDNFVLFWAKEYGDDPMANSITNRRFDVDGILKESDRFYDYYVNT